MESVYIDLIGKIEDINNVELIKIPSPNYIYCNIFFINGIEFEDTFKKLNSLFKNIKKQNFFFNISEKYPLGAIEINFLNGNKTKNFFPCNDQYNSNLSSIRFQYKILNKIYNLDNLNDFSDDLEILVDNCKLIIKNKKQDVLKEKIQEGRGILSKLEGAYQLSRIHLLDLMKESGLRGVN